MRSETLVRTVPGLAFALALLGACGGGSGGSGDDVVEIPFTVTSFSGHAIDNPWLPLAPGTRRTYEAETEDGFEEVLVEVTTDTKTILGVACVVVRDTVTLDGELVEDTLDWFAQDDDGNVWYFGEDSKDYEDGLVVSTQGSWEAGVNGAQAGIAMLADPRLGRTYAQEDAPGVAEDRARVAGLGEVVTVPWGTFPDCLHTEDFSPLEPGVIEDKYYAPGVGLVLEVDEDGVRTELVLVETV